MNINRQIDEDGAGAAIFDERLPEPVPKYISHLEGGEIEGTSEPPRRYTDAPRIDPRRLGV